MEVVTIEQAAEEAKVEWKQYCKAIRENIPSDAEYMRYYKSIKNALYYLSQGKQIIDIHASMKAAGLSDKGLPNLAICNAALSKVFFEWEYSRAVFSDGRWNSKKRIVFPTSLFGIGTKQSTTSFSAVVPKVPAQFLPKGNLSNYHILWEVEEWNLEPPIDPILLRRIKDSPNLFAVMAVWDLTKLERAVLRGAVM